MPIVRVPLTGSQNVAMANVTLQRTYSLTGDTVTTLDFIRGELPCLGLPALTYWVRLNSAVGGVVFTPLFSVQNTTVAGAPSPDWLPFNNGIILVPGNVSTFSIRSAVAVMGCQFSIPPAAPASTVSIDIVLMAGG